MMLLSVTLHLLGLNHEVVTLARELAINSTEDAANNEHDCPSDVGRIWLQKQAMVFFLTLFFPIYHYARYKLEIRALFEDTFCRRRDSHIWAKAYL